MLYFKYRSTNCFFLRSSLNGQLLAIDAGWPGTLYEYARGMKTIGCNLDNIAWAFVTHFHMDHAGLISEFVTRGVKCFVFEHQLGAIDAMEKTIEKNDKSYRRIDKTKLHVIKIQESREMLEEVGIRGQVVVTAYHSSDSISFITEQGEAIVGDLPLEAQMMPDDHRLREAWDEIRKSGGRTIYPSHAASFELVASYPR